MSENTIYQVRLDNGFYKEFKKKEKVIKRCQYCNEEVERVKINIDRFTTCFLCRKIKNKTILKI